MLAHRTIRSFLLSATILSLPHVVLAQDAATEITSLDEIIVSGGLSPIAASGYGRAYTALTADDIETRGLTTLQDALRAIPGLAVSGSGSSYTEVRLRGGEANHVLVLIDGVEARGGDDQYVLTGLETATIERIEVLRGPQSAYYGSNASSGVINIVTRKGAEVGTEYGGKIEVGNGTAVSGHVSTRGERGGIALSFGWRDDKGYDFSGDGGDADGTERRTLALTGDFMVTDSLQLGFALRRSAEHYEFDGNSWTAATAEEYVIDSADYSDRDEATATVWAELATLDGRLTHRLSYARGELDQGYNGAPQGTGSTEALKYRAIWGIDGAVAGANQTLSLALDKQRDENSLAAGNQRESTSVALEYRGSFANGLEVQGGIRHDDNKVFADATTYSLGLSYALQNGVRLHASAGTGVVNPSYLELFGGFGSVGAPGLTPERNRAFDLGVEIPVLGGRGTVDVTYFNERLEDEISYSGAPLPDGSNYFNQAGTSTREGVEITGQFAATDTLNLGASYTYLDARDPGGSIEIRRPRHMVGLSAQWQTFGGRGSLSADLRYVADNYDTQFFGTYATAKLPNYLLADIAVGYDLTDNVRLTGRVTNLLDTEYVDTWGYATQGRTAYLGLEAKF